MTEQRATDQRVAERPDAPDRLPIPAEARLEPEVVPTRPAPEHVAGDVTAAETGPASVPLAGAASTTPARATGPAVVSALVEGLATGHVNADTTTPQTPTAARTRRSPRLPWRSARPAPSAPLRGRLSRTAAGEE